jgi:hypothetical protein
MSSKEAGYLRFNFVIPTTFQLRALMTSQKVHQTNDTWESIELGFPQTPCVHALGAAARGDQVPFMPCIYAYIPGLKTCSCSLSQTSSQLSTRIETSGKHRRHEVSPAIIFLWVPDFSCISCEAAWIGPILLVFRVLHVPTVD